MSFRPSFSLLGTLLLVSACVHAPAAEPVAPAPVAAVEPPEEKPLEQAVEAPRATAEAVVEPAPAPVPPPADVEALLKKLTVDQKVGQLMMVGFGGLVLDPKIEALVKGRQVGGICMFKRNISDPAQVARLNDALRALMAPAIPPFIAVDQEGGNVVRIADGVTVLPGNMALGATRSSKLAFEAGKAQGEDLRRLGFNMNLAPVLDVNLNPRNPVIGIRSFGDQAPLVSQMGSDFVRGQQEANIATVAKHFPGHGAVDADSHKGLPVLQETEVQVLEGLEPFSAAMKVGLDGLMTAHIAVPKITGDDTPATLSHEILTNLLRRRLGFEGLVLTDELEMEAIADHYGVGKAAVLAVNAGADMVLVPWRQEKKLEVYLALLEAAQSGALPAERLDEAVRRILSLKLKRGLFEPLPPLAQRLSELGSGKAVSASIAAGAVTLLKAGEFPLKRTQTIAVVTAEPSLAKAIQARVPNAKVLLVPQYPTPDERNPLKQQARRLAEAADITVVGVANTMQLELVTIAALTGKPVVVVVMGVPYLGAQVPQAQTVLLTYSSRETATEAAAAALFAEAGTPGRLPVALPMLGFGFGLDPVGDRTKAASRGGAR
jgi:beta-N-acetylhexosaminidase